MPDAVYGPYKNLAGLGYVDCLTCGAMVPQEKGTQHTNFHQTFTNRRDLEVSKTAWCDYDPEGGHAYKNGEPGSASFDAREVNDEGTLVDTTMDACAKHNPLAIRRQAARYELTPKAYEELNERGPNRGE